jgi:hypothetical protein
MLPFTCMPPPDDLLANDFLLQFNYQSDRSGDFVHSLLGQFSNTRDESLQIHAAELQDISGGKLSSGHWPNLGPNVYARRSGRKRLSTP